LGLPGHGLDDLKAIGVPKKLEDIPGLACEY
jgi:hypothetical protein